MSRKLAPPGVSVLPMNVQYPSKLGPVHSFSVVMVHQGGRNVYMARGGQYTILMGYSHLQAHIDLLAQDTLNTLVYWDQKEHRIIVDTMTEERRKIQMIEKAKQHQAYAKLMALKELATPLIREIQEELKVVGEALVEKEVARESPKNGHDHAVSNDVSGN